MKHTPMKRMLALLLALLLALSTIALAEEAVEAPVEAGEVIQEAEPTNPEEPAGEVPAADDAADNADDADDDADDDAADTADDAAGDADADADDGEIVAAVAAEDVSVSAEAVDAVIEEEEEELIDEEAVEEEVELVDEDEVYGEPVSVNENNLPYLIIGGNDFFQNAKKEENGKFVWSAEKHTESESWPKGWTGTFTFDPNGKTLTLDNVSFVTRDIGLLYSDEIRLETTEAALDGMNMGADSTPTLTVDLVGNNEIIANGSLGMSVEGPLCIQGKGSLSIISNQSGFSKGIACTDLTINDAPTINVTAEGSQNAIGIMVSPLDEESSDGGTFVMNGGTLTVTAGEAEYSIGIEVENNMSITGGTLTAQSEGVKGPELAEAGEALMEVGPSGGFAAGAVAWDGELSLGDKMQLKYGKDASSATVHTAGDFNKMLEEHDSAALPLYFRVEPKPTNPDTPAAPAGRPDPSFPIDTLFFATVVSDSEDAHALKLAWTPANNVDGYDVFLKRCNAKKKEPFKLVGTSTGLECKVTDLKKSKCYKGYVQPYVMEGNVKKYVLEPSKRFHVYTNNGRKGLSNPANVKVKYSKAEKKAGRDVAKKKTVPLGKTIKIKATVTGAKRGKVIEHVAKLRLYPSKPNVVKVVRKKGKNGKKGYVGLKGVGEGTCKVYVLTNNGICDYFTITVTTAAVANAGKKKGKK